MARKLIEMERAARAMEHSWCSPSRIEEVLPVGRVECSAHKVLRADGSRGMYGDTSAIRWKLNGKVISAAALNALVGN